MRGVTLCSSAKAHKRRDGTGVFVIVRHELALQPGLAVWEVFHDPKDGRVKLEGENVAEFPKMPEFQQVTLKVLRWEERDKRRVGGRARGQGAAGEPGEARPPAALNLV